VIQGHASDLLGDDQAIAHACAQAADLLDGLAASMPGFNKEGALKRLCGRADMLARLLHVFVRTSQDAIGAVKAHADRGEHAQLAAAAHALRGACGSVGLDNMARWLNELEALALQGAPHAPYTAMLREIEQEMRALRENLAEHDRRMN
jgi:HPt (histidine-containing phosphotransfer) domain-containing protein